MKQLKIVGILSNEGQANNLRNDINVITWDFIRKVFLLNLLIYAVISNRITVSLKFTKVIAVLA